MDEVVEQLGATAISESGANRTNYENLYKNRGRVGNQEDRRKNLLETQKDSRNNKLDNHRGILQLVEAVERDSFQPSQNRYRPSIFVSGYTKIPNYCNVLMMSEWMYEKPVDFEENWLVVPCPKGIRMLVVAHKGITKCYNKYGNFRFECRTALPGGNPCQIKKNKDTVVLDCYYQEECDTMYVLDVLAWNECVMTEGEAGFRHFWLVGHMEQIPELQLITKKNKLIFKIIPKFPCTKESLSKFLSVFPFYNHNMPPVDGLLFFHQMAQYCSGETPLVGWLFPYMINEVLGTDIDIHQGYMLEKPVGYTNYLNFIEIFENRNFRKKQRHIFGPKNKLIMDTMLPENPQVEPSTTENTNENACKPDEVDIADSDSMNENANAAVVKNGNGDGAVPKDEEKMEADTNAAGTNVMEAMVADIINEEEN